ncbi:hypothetical protein CLOSBL3_30075 [Clostridiaceae bacterium BL-3]|nr:hypothetical protein CLOSBL3_30075 [Clostridiaceae bacterium BL-3]
MNAYVIVVSIVMCTNSGHRPRHYSNFCYTIMLKEKSCT